MNSILNEEILSSIDKIDECVMEAESAVINSMYDYCQKAVMFYENYNGDECDCFDVFMETSTDGTKRSFGSKIKAIAVKLWGMIKKFFSFIARQLMRVINFIKRLFVKNNNPASIDQCIKEIGIEPDNQVNRYKTTERLHFRNIEDKHVEVDIDIITKDFFLKFDKDESITIEFYPAYERNNIKLENLLKSKSDIVEVEDLPVKDQDVIASYYISAVYFLLLNQDYLYNLENIVNMINNVINNKITDKSILSNLHNKIQLYLSEYAKEVGKINIDSFDPKISMKSFKLKDIVTLQQRITELSTAMSNFSNPETDLSWLDNNNVINFMKSLMDNLNNIQMGLNGLTGAMKQIYIVDSRYIGCCKNLEQLDELVKSMINHGIPSKYIAYNAYLILDKNISGYNEYKPKWGQSRIVFFPVKNEDIVYKVALSGFGIQSNINEYKLYQKVEKSGLSAEKILAPVTKIFKNYSVIEMKRFGDDDSKPVDDFTARKQGKRIDNLFKSNGINCSIYDDAHGKNFAYKSKSSDDIVMIDYGLIKK